MSEDPALNGTSGYHTLLPRIKDHDEERLESVRARGNGQLQQDSVFLSQQDSDTYECRAVVTAWAITHTRRKIPAWRRGGHELLRLSEELLAVMTDGRGRASFL